MCVPGLFPAPGYLAPFARAPPCWLGLSPAGHRSWPGQVGVSGWQSFCSTIGPRYPLGHKCSPLFLHLPKLQGGAPHLLPRLDASGLQIAPTRHSYLGGRHASAGVQEALRPALRLDCTGDPGDSLPVPAEVGAVILPGSMRAWPASPRPPGAGHAGAVSPLAGPGQGLRGARDLKASAL